MSPEYLAGFFDGEGCVNINVRGEVRQVCLRCDLVNTDLDHLKEVQRHFGGHVHQRPFKDKPNWKPFCSITWHGRYAADLLRKLQPYLRLKTRQAALALEFFDFMQLPKDQRCDLKRSPEPKMRNGMRVQWVRKPETLRRELDYKARMHVLNRKGIAHAQL